MMNLKNINKGRLSFHRAFTLVELLVVISVIAMLLAVLMPALSKARNQAITLTCKTRMKDIGIAFGLYISANNGDMPFNDWPDQSDPSGDKRWNVLVAPYYNLKDRKSTAGIGTYFDYKLFRCPTQDYMTNFYQENLQSGNTTNLVKSPKTGKMIHPVGAAGIYGYNMYFSGMWKKNGVRDYNWRKASSIKQTSGLVIFADLAAETTAKGFETVLPAGALMEVDWPHPDAAQYGYTMRGTKNVNEYGPAPNHQGKINYMYADNHVETIGNLWPWNDFSNPLPANKYFHPVRDTSVLPY